MPRIALSKSSVLPLLFLGIAGALVVATVTLNAVLEGDSAWAKATAAGGLVATVAAAAVVLATGQAWANGTGRSLVASAVAVVGLGALALTMVTYIGGASGGGSSIAATDIAISDEALALFQQQTDNSVQPPGFSHDVGQHPTLGEFAALDSATLLRNSPGGTLLPTEVDELKAQLAELRAFVQTVNTVEKAQAAGYQFTTNDVPFMGAHLLNFSYVSDGVFDPGKPEGLLFSKLDGDEWIPVGAWFLLVPGVNPGVTEAIPPQAFAGNLDLWHEHHGLCTRNNVISENNTAAGCAEDNGSFIGDLKWMMHVWAWPENAENVDGVFTYLNYGLFEKQQNVVSFGPGGE